MLFDLKRTGASFSKIRISISSAPENNFAPPNALVKRTVKISVVSGIYNGKK